MTGLGVPLSVFLQTSATYRSVTRDVRDLQFREAAPGGFASCTIALDRPLATQPQEIAYFGQVIVADRRTGQVVWQGRLDEPGRGAGSDGQVWQITAVGPAAHVHDRTVPLIYVDTGIDKYLRVDNTTPGATAQTSTDPADAAGTRQVLLMQFPQGLSLVTNAAVALRYPLLAYTGQKIARIDFSSTQGVTNASFAVQAVMRTDGTGAQTARTFTFNTTPAGASARVITTDWTAGRNQVDFRITYTGAGTTVAADNVWAAVASVVVMATRYTAAGVELTAAADYGANYVFADQVVADLLGRLLTDFAGATASIDTTASYHIEQLSYPDGVDAGKVLDDLMALETAFYWAAWEGSPARFEWRRWPTTVRYDADISAGFDSPASADGLYNRVTVRYKEPNGLMRTVTRTQAVTELDAIGKIRQGFVDLGDEAGTAANAAQVGDLWLAERRTPPNAGTLTVAEPVVDISAGRLVQPWEIRAGELIRVRGVLPRADALNATTRDGVTVFRIVSRSYSASSNTATLELDAYAPSLARAINRAAAPTGRRR